MKKYKKIIIELVEEERDIIAKAQYIWEEIANKLDYENNLISEYEEMFDDMNKQFKKLCDCLDNGFELKHSCSECKFHEYTTDYTGQETMVYCSKDNLYLYLDEVPNEDCEEFERMA